MGDVFEGTNPSRQLTLTLTLIPNRSPPSGGLEVGKDNWFTQVGAKNAVKIDDAIPDGTAIKTLLESRLNQHSTLSMNGAGLSFPAATSMSVEFMAAFRYTQTFIA